MSFLSSVYAYLFYFAAFVLVAGLINKVVQYARTPAPLKIPTTPALVVGAGVVGILSGAGVRAYCTTLFTRPATSTKAAK